MLVHTPPGTQSVSVAVVPPQTVGKEDKGHGADVTVTMVDT